MSIKDHIKGLNHIGIPVKNTMEAVKLYESLGFVLVDKVRNIGDSERLCAFMKNKEITLEIYESVFEGYSGVIDHIALSIDDFDSVWNEIQNSDFYEVQYGGPSGVSNSDWHSKYVTVKTPSGEKIEFNQTIVDNKECGM